MSHVVRVVLCVVSVVPAVLAQSAPRVEELRERATATDTRFRRFGISTSEEIRR
jgi:hypothetical protein